MKGNTRSVLGLLLLALLLTVFIASPFPAMSEATTQALAAATPRPRVPATPTVQPRATTPGWLSLLLTPSLPAAVATRIVPPGATATPAGANLPAWHAQDAADAYPTAEVSVSRNNVNCRTDATLGRASVLGPVPPRTPLTATGQLYDGQWLRVCCIQRQSCWLRSQLVQADADLSDLPIVLYPRADASELAAAMPWQDDLLIPRAWWLADIPSPAAKELLLKSNIFYVFTANDHLEVVARLVLDNQDPQTVNKRYGRIYFYNAVDIPIPKNARVDYLARNNGDELKYRKSTQSGTLDKLHIEFGRRLFFKQRMIINLKLTVSSSEYFYLSPNTARFPLWVPGDVGYATALFPLEFEVSLEDFRCQVERTGAWQKVECPLLEVANDLVDFVVAERPSQYQSYHGDIPLSGGELPLTVSYFRGDRDWAVETASLLKQALPIVEELMGFPYDGPERLEVYQVTGSDIGGYAGEQQQGVLLVRTGEVDDLIVHEAAHLWSTPFAETWLSEGWAEWVTFETGRRLHLDFPRPGSASAALAGPLQAWTHEASIDSALTSQREMAYYRKAFRVIELLVEQVGLEALQALNRQFLPGDRGAAEYADSYTYYRALQGEGYDVSDIWDRYVLTEAGKARLGR